MEERILEGSKTHPLDVLADIRVALYSLCFPCVDAMKRIVTPLIATLAVVAAALILDSWFPLSFGDFMLIYIYMQISFWGYEAYLARKKKGPQ